MNVHSYENSPYRYWPDGLTEADIDALMGEAGIDIHEASLDLVDAPGWNETPASPNRASELDPPAAGHAAA